MEQTEPYKTIPISEFLEILSQDKPALPAAGSALGLSGAIAASLAIFVSKLVNKSVLPGDIQSHSQKTINEIIDLQRSCMEIMDLDKNAYEKIIQGMRKTCIDESEIAKRDQFLQEAYSSATQIPMKLNDISLSLLNALDTLLEYVPDASKADAFIAAEMAYACLKGTAYIIQVNVNEIKTKQIGASFLTHMQNNLKNGKGFYENIINSNLYSVEDLKE